MIFRCYKIELSVKEKNKIQQEVCWLIRLFRKNARVASFVFPQHVVLENKNRSTVKVNTMKKNVSINTTLPKKNSERGLTVVVLPHRSFSEYFITAIPVDGESFSTMLARINSLLKKKNAVVLSQDIFGISSRNGYAEELLENTFGSVNWPITWLEGDGASRYSGTYLWAISGCDIRTISIDGRIVGTVFEDKFARYCRLGDIVSDDQEAFASQQTADVFETIDRALSMANMSFNNVIRTWFYNDDILAWYDEFNILRDSHLRSHNIHESFVPASTGIGAANNHSKALVSGVLAICGKNDSYKVQPLVSPLQCSALQYGSSFSRVVEISVPGHSQVFISGTASIDRDGNTVFKGDMNRQVSYTMDVVSAILQSRKLTWHNVVRSLVYISRQEDYKAYRRYCREKNVPDFPVIITNNVICRDDLMFEIELDAVADFRKVGKIRKS